MMMYSTLLLLLLPMAVHAMCVFRVYGPDTGCLPGTRLSCIDSRCMRRCDCIPCPVPPAPSTVQCIPGTRLTCGGLGADCIQDCKCEPYPYANDDNYFTLNEHDIYFNITSVQYSAIVSNRRPLTPGFIDVTHLANPTRDVSGLRGMHRFDHADVGSPRLDIPLTQAKHVLAASTRVNQSRIEHHRDVIATRAPYRYTYSLAGVAASILVRDMLIGAPGATVTMVKGAHQSVIMSIPGTSKADEIVIVSTHLDTRNTSLGGVDNVSGSTMIAVAMEACLAILDFGVRPLRTIECHFYAGHYVGYTGSSRIAEFYSDQGKHVVGVYNLDGVAQTAIPDSYVYLVDSWPDMTDSVATQFVGSLVRAYAPLLVPVKIGCGFACSDHTSWGRMGYPTTTVIVDGGCSTSTILEHAKIATAFAIELGYK